MNDFRREYKILQPELTSAFNRVLESGWYVLGPEVENFEREFANFTGSQYCIGVANGLEALQISLLALGVGAGDEVITVSNSAVATVLAITQTGAKPVFVDIDEYYHLDPSKLTSVITKNTKAIMPVHLYGQLANNPEILKIANQTNIPLVEDACQAHGATHNDIHAGNFGTLGCFSFYPTKNLGAYGDAGAITTNSAELKEKVLLLRNYGQRKRYYHSVVGINSRLDELQAALLRVKLKYLPEMIERRRGIANLYLQGLEKIDAIEVPKIRSKLDHAFHLFVLLVPEREKLQRYLLDRGIETLIHYPVPIHQQACYPEYNHQQLERTEYVAKHTVSLPMHPFLSTEEVEYIVASIKEYYS